MQRSRGNRDMPKRVNPRRVKIHRSYSVEEAAIVLGTHKQTVRNWLKAGLPKVGGRGVTLVLGKELRTFLEARQARARRRCPPGHLYCMKCREPRVPGGGMLEYVLRTAQTGDLVACCPKCLSMMHRRTRVADAAALFASMGATLPHAELHIDESADQSVFADSQEVADADAEPPPG